MTRYIVTAVAVFLFLADDAKKDKEQLQGSWRAVSSEQGGKAQVVLGATDSVRSYDLATGKQIWESALGAASRGIPAMYEHEGRQYLLMTASDPGVGPNRTPRLELPHGLIAFALPVKQKGS